MASYIKSLEDLMRIFDRISGGRASTTAVRLSKYITENPELIEIAKKLGFPVDETYKVLSAANKGNIPFPTRVVVPEETAAKRAAVANQWLRENVTSRLAVEPQMSAFDRDWMQRTASDIKEHVRDPKERARLLEQLSMFPEGKVDYFSGLGDQGIQTLDRPTALANYWNLVQNFFNLMVNPKLPTHVNPEIAMEMSRDWYTRANQVVKMLAKEFKVPEEEAAYILAMLSPQTMPAPMVRNAHIVLQHLTGRTGDPSLLLPNTTGAGLISRGVSTGLGMMYGLNPFAMVNAPKTATFGTGLLDPRYPDAVIDFGMGSIGMGQHIKQVTEDAQPIVATALMHAALLAEKMGYGSQGIFQYGAKTPMQQQAALWALQRNFNIMPRLGFTTQYAPLGTARGRQIIVGTAPTAEFRRREMEVIKRGDPREIEDFYWSVLMSDPRYRDMSLEGFRVSPGTPGTSFREIVERNERAAKKLAEENQPRVINLREAASEYIDTPQVKEYREKTKNRKAVE